MINLDEIEKRYQNLSAIELIKIANNHQTLRTAVIPLLVKELTKRGEEALARQVLEEQLTVNPYESMSSSEIQKKVDERLAQGELLEDIKAELENHDVHLVNPYEGLSLSEIQKIVSERLLSGEPLESIKTDLESYGVNTLDLFNKESDRDLEIAERLNTLSNSGLSKEQVEATISNEHSIDQSELGNIKKKLNSRAKSYTIIGFVLLAVGCIYTLFIVANVNYFSGKMIRPLILFFGGGLSFLYKAHLLTSRNT